MKFQLSSRIFTLLLAGLLVPGAYAAGARQGNLHVTDPIQVNGKQLSPGDYNVSWDGDGPDVTVHFARGHKELATAPAKVVQLDKKSSEDATLVTTSTSGQRELSGLRFSGKPYELDIAGSSQAGGEGAK